LSHYFVIDYVSIIDLLDKAEKLDSEFLAGQSGQFLSAEKFYLAMSDIIYRCDS